MQGRQIPLPLEPRQEARLKDFVAGPNQVITHALDALVADNSKAVWLSGPPGSGKTHLLSACYHGVRARGGKTIYLGIKRLPENSHHLLAGLEQMDLVCIDDVALVAGNSEWEEALFHLFNQLREQGSGLLVAAASPLASVSFQLPDLRSRLAWGLQFTLKPLAAADKPSVLSRHADRLGLMLPNKVAEYLLRHGDRSASNLVRQLERLQEAAYSDKRKLTVPLARQILNS